MSVPLWIRRGNRVYLTARGRSAGLDRLGYLIAPWQDFIGYKLFLSLFDAAMAREKNVSKATIYAIEAGVRITPRESS